MRLAPFVLILFACLVLVASAQQGSTPPPPSDGLPDGPGKSELIKVCGECHAATRATALRLTRDGWALVIDDMVKGGAHGTDKELESILNYLSKNFLGETARAINLNTAPSIDLESVVGLLRSEARALIAWRERTPCKKIEDLKDVPGLDYKKIEAARERIACFER